MNQTGSLRYILLSVLMLSLSRPALAQRDLKVIPDPDPELERQTFIVPDGVEVKLFAADPRIAKPIQMNFDSAGRLWIASSEVYPHIKPGQQANDKVLVLEDRDGDGTADETRVFADGLLIPTGVLPGHDGVYVANSTELLHFRDTDGDGKADQRRVVLSGFGTEDTHHILHTLRWGRDGCMYFNQSIYIHSHIETPWGVRRLNGGGIWRFRPETLQLEVYARGFINTWGHHFDAYGQSFASDGAGGEGVNYVVQGAAYPTAVGVPRILHGLNPGSPKHCGLEIVDGRHLPDDWQGSVVTNDFRGHRVCRFVLSDDGSGFASRQQVELIKSSHVAFRPIDVKMGPDGAIYIADWYNPIIQHGEVDFRDERRDHTHGRIWRLSFQDRPLVERPQFERMSTEELLRQLESPESWTRTHAQRVLVEKAAARDAGLIEQVDRWVSNLDPNDELKDRHRLEALWLYQALLTPREELLEQCLTSIDARVRAAALRVSVDWLPVVSAARRTRLIEQIGDATSDPHPRVRLEALGALRKIPTPASVETATRVLSQDMDRFLDYALWLICWEQRSIWIPEFQQGNLRFGQDPQRLAFAIEAAGQPGTVQPLVKLFESGEIPEADRSAILKVITVLGNADELGLVYQLAMRSETPGQQRAELLNSLAAAARNRQTLPAGNLESVVGYLDDAALRQTVIGCVGAWKLESARPQLETLLANAKTARPIRLASLSALAELGGGASWNAIGQVARSESDVEVRVRAIELLIPRQPALSARLAVDFLSKTQESATARPLVASFLRRPAAAQTLAKELAKSTLQEDVAKIGLRVIGESGRANDELANAFRAAGGITSGPRQLSAAEMQQLVAEVREQGDAQRGEQVYRRSELLCSTCHAIGGAGGRVGPDLVSIGASAQVDYLIESIIDPNKKVKENYHTIIAALDDGQVVSGIKVRQTDSALVLRDAKDVERSIPLDSIEDQAQGISMMPVGLTEKLTRSELMDLVAFLSSLGRVEDFSVGRRRLARRWRAMAATPEAAFKLRRTAYSQAASDDPAFQWEAVYSRVDGQLPLDSLPNVAVRNRVAAGQRGVAFARTELEVTTPGKFELRVGSTDGLTAWLDEKPVNLAESVTLDLSPGRHRITLAVDKNSRTAPLMLELVDVAGSVANVQFVSGK